MNICVMGGDLRNFFLAKLLSKEKHEVKVYGFEKIENFRECETYENMLSSSEIVVLSIPFTKDKKTINMPLSNRNIRIQELAYHLENKTIFVGNMPEDIQEILKEKQNEVIDFMKKEEFAVLNAIPTAEATIEIILKNTNKILQGSHCLILGFGRIGKVLAHKLQGLAVDVTCMVTNEIEKAWAIAYGYQTTTIEKLQNFYTKIKQYDIIINTIPKIIFKEELKEIKKETLVIDLASKPYGIDRKIVEEENINFIEALGLPREISTNDISKIYERHHKTIYINKKLKQK